MIRQTKVLIADEHLLVRDGIKMLVAAVLDDVQFLDAYDGDSLLHAAALSPSARLALVDIQMPGMRGGRRLAEVASLHPIIPLVVVSALSSPDVVRRAMEIPTVYAFVPKSAGKGAMHSAIEAALQRRKFSPAQLMRDIAQPVARLTPRQEEIRVLLRQGMSNKMIAGALGISAGTVKNHLTDIFRALNTTNRTQAARLNLDAE